MEELREHDRVTVKLWTGGLPVEPQAMQQVRNVAGLPIVAPHVAIMPDVHWGYGATVGSVIPTVRAIIPAAVGVDIGCGMMATRTDVDANEIKPSVLRAAIEDNVPVGGPGVRGSWSERRFGGDAPERIRRRWQTLDVEWAAIAKKYPKLAGPTLQQLGTLGTGNHFIEVCLAENDTRLWVMLHSGSRGAGNRIGTHFTNLAKEAMLTRDPRPALGDPDLAWLDEGTDVFDDYVQAVGWAQRFATSNREAMMRTVLHALATHVGRIVEADQVLVNCHHNYVVREKHFGQDVWLTRKGAVSAKRGELGIIPGSMGARSYIVRGLGNPESFESCSHGAGRRMSRGAARRTISVEEHLAATEGVECEKRPDLVRDYLDESPAAYKDIDAVIAAQTDLVEPIYVLKQIVCVKG